MKKRHLLLTLMAMTLSMSAVAQWSIWVSGGCALNFYKYDPQYMEGLEYKPHWGFVADIPVTYQFNDWLSLSTGIALQQKGYTLDGSFIPSESNSLAYFYKNLRRDDSYFIVPIMAEFSFGKGKWKCFVDAGGYMGWWCNSRFAYKQITSVSSVISEEMHYEPRQFYEKADQRWEFGASGGVGVRYGLSKTLSLFFATRSYIAFTSQQKNYQTMHFPSYNITLTAQFGLVFNIN